MAMAKQEAEEDLLRKREFKLQVEYLLLSFLCLGFFLFSPANSHFVTDWCVWDGIYRK